MSGRASVDGRLFLAAVPNAATAARIIRLAGVLKRAHGLSGELIAADRLHVSLLFLGTGAKEERAIDHELKPELSSHRLKFPSIGQLPLAASQETALSCCSGATG